MALMRDLSQAQLAFQVAGGEVDRFLVIRYRGTEGLCQLYRFEIELVSTEQAVGFDEIVGKPAALSINTENGQRYFHGIVSRFELTAETAEQNYYRAELVPSVWLLTHRYNSRIFQNKTVPEIITDVLTKGGVPSDRFSLEDLTGDYQPQEYRVQYRETDYNFICRLMEEQGMFWYFTQSLEGHVLVIVDSQSSYAPIEGDEATLPYAPPTGMKVEEEHVFRFRIGQAVRPGKVALADYNFENPALDLGSSSDAGRDEGLEFYDYPGDYTEQSAGQGLAQLRMEEFETGRIHAVGKSNSYRLCPGRTFELTEHPSDPLNMQYMITSVTHQGKQSTTRSTTGGNGQAGILSSDVFQTLMQLQRGEDASLRDCARALLHLASRVAPADETAHRALTPWLYHAGQVTRDPSTTAMAMGGNPLESLATPNLLEDVSHSSNVDRDAPVYECRFECIPASVSYRPPRVTPWPVVRGAQIAQVTGPAGEEIYPDEYGRVKVKFPWDREGKHDENSSCWIRVSQGLAGGSYGMMFLPRVGQEVVVDFLEGNPDEPLIVGRVYNADHMPPYTLPDEKTKSVIKTRSSTGGGGANEIRFEDLKDKEQILVYAQKDFHVRANNDRVENVGHDRHLTVKEQKFELVKKNKHNEVKLDFNEKVGGKMSLAVTGDLGEKIGGNHGEEVEKNYALKANSKIVVESPEITLKSGGNFVKIDSSGVTILGTKVNINSGGSAGTASVAAPSKPEQTVDADSVKPGKDVTYTGGKQLAAAEMEAEVAGHVFEPEEVEEKETSWIEIELVDQEGAAVARAAYEITAPDGETIKKGRLDENGRAYVSVAEPGNCQISFPKLDEAAWERA